MWDLYPGHRTLYIGVHVPLGNTRHRSQHRHRHHGKKQWRRSRQQSLPLVEGRESPVYGKTHRYISSCYLIQFILNIWRKPSQTPPRRGCSSCWGQKMRMRSTSPMTSSLKWMRSACEMERTLSGGKVPGTVNPHVTKYHQHTIITPSAAALIEKNRSKPWFHLQRWETSTVVSCFRAHCSWCWVITQLHASVTVRAC